ncbi:hypothetical protein G3N95_16150 [Paraburkholderia sp. Tr-20389]|uniref:hypothetical protein n=1 Tax=Paraburkholderia sp. Tr-20389 TaxID=2703903 RepID=UPI00197F7BC7|nr:hypothetical protein [Paraburkholderia sp. Tr-20389]MBN3754482.1 hypothetical protein [Paraburkholderia sp. Tr-20389]
MSDVAGSEIRTQFRELWDAAAKYFDEARKCAVSQEAPTPFGGGYTSSDPNFYWDQLSEDLRGLAMALVDRLLIPCAALAEAARVSPLTGSEDQLDVKIAAKAMRAALRLRRYIFQEASVIHDEDVVLGFRPADQSELSGLPPDQAESEFYAQLDKVSLVLKLVEASPASAGQVVSRTQNDSSKYRIGTAFIMMWMDPSNPELTDTVETVRNIFQQFEVRALRADDIEHEGLISERVLNEIRTSEFLFADLTGARPNVYYEVGYAHALGKRVILFRKSGTGIHFDLSGYNCPEYVNQTDLRKKLTNRLIELTNRKPREIEPL